jgi:hypothetical protein
MLWLVAAAAAAAAARRMEVGGAVAGAEGL